jgi:hypothetical protein
MVLEVVLVRKLSAYKNKPQLLISTSTSSISRLHEKKTLQATKIKCRQEIIQQKEKFSPFSVKYSHLCGGYSFCITETSHHSFIKTRN